eukprot:Phypoly_transcript_15979.p1 GENE.Phypoly_transcript_15979~~Phypoly_transcript_15979.p1  ORF type:complete len:249 (+),score=26.39 Phypoly_transcript_15979:85-831(+)
MEAFWKMVCCLHLRGAVDDNDNSLLDPETGHDTLSSSHNRDREDVHITQEIEAFEGVTQRIIETIGQLEGFSSTNIQQTLTDCMNCIPSQHIRFYILSHFLDTLTKTNKMATLKHLVATLDEKQQKELEGIITGLPSSVLGDAVAKESTRVLVDVFTDTKECSQIDKSRITPHKKFVDTTIEMMQQTLAPLHDAMDREKVIVGILTSQLPSIKMKITLKLIVFSRYLQPDPSARVEFMHQLLNSHVSM